MKISVILSTLAAAALVSAGKFHPLPKADTRHVPGGFIVEFQDDIPRTVAHNALNSKKVDYKVRNDYSVFNGAAISVNSKHDGNDIAAIPGVKNVWPITLHSIPKVVKSDKKANDPLTANLHQMTGVDIVHKKHKLTGKGIKVGIIDTGVDYKHPAFAAKGAKDGCFGRRGKNCRITHGWDFVGDAYDGFNQPKPDSDPMDCQGHGTHVAGIVGANALNIKSSPKPPQPFIGVAPEVSFGAYRIFGCDGQAGDDVIMAAMEMAFNDGMDPLAQGKHRNMSTISLPPTIPRRHNIKEAERKEIFPISDEGAPPIAGRRGSIGFFRGRRALAPMSLNHEQLFQNLQNLQNLDMTHCSWQSYHCLNTADSDPSSNIHSLSTTPTTAATTPALTATPTTPVTGCYNQSLGLGQGHNYGQGYGHGHGHGYGQGHGQGYKQGQGHLSAPYNGPRSFSQPTSPVAASIQDYHPRQEQKLASFMKRNLLPPHTLTSQALQQGQDTANPDSFPSVVNSVSSSLAHDCSSGPTSPSVPADHRHYDHHPHNPNHHHHHQQPHHTARPTFEHQSGLDTIPSTMDVPTLSISEWGNRDRWEGEQEWSDEIPPGLEHDDGPWDTMDRQVVSYTVEQHITRATFKGQNYSAPLDFSKKPEQPATVEGVEANGVHIPASSSLSSMATLSSDSQGNMNSLPKKPLTSRYDERSLVILTVGCGNSQWATEMALAHPQSAIHAINVSQLPTLPAVPETTPTFDLDNLFFYNLDDNSLKIPFVSNSVDYIHVRRFLPNVNKTKYLAFLRELVRVLKVDGYLELVELDLRLRDSGVDSCWPSYWTLIGFDKLGIDTSLALNLAGILRTMPGMDVAHKSSVNMPVGIHGGRAGLAAELLCWRFAANVRPWLMRQAMLSGSEFDELLERARQETRVLKSYQVCHIAVGRKTCSS
ncbi:hypothetical protein BGZ94_007561 [Podila epigama]|nr:hypothetical protein BGZ94_007561 [Podila epigama]